MNKSCTNFSRYAIFLFCCIYGGCSSRQELSCRQVEKDIVRITQQAQSNDEKIIHRLIELSNPNSQCQVAMKILIDRNFAQNDTLNSKVLLHRMRAKSPTNVYCLYGLGLVYMSEKKYDSSLIYLSKAAQIKDHSGVVTDYTDAFENITGKITYDIPYSSIIYHIGKVNFEQKKYKHAFTDLSYVISQNYNLPEAYLLRSQINFYLGDSINGCQDIQRAVEVGFPVPSYLSDKCNRFKLQE